MADNGLQRGQAMVELALVLPCLCIAIFVGVQLIVYCHNVIELQRMAQVMTDRQQWTQSLSSRYTRFHSLWGAAQPEQIRRVTLPGYRWRPFHGISTIQTAGQIYAVRVGAITPARFGIGGTTRQKTEAQGYLEPLIPEEKPT